MSYNTPAILQAEHGLDDKVNISLLGLLSLSCVRVRKGEKAMQSDLGIRVWWRMGKCYTGKE